MPDSDCLSRLKKRLGKIRDVESTAAVLEWDQETYMPPGAVKARAEQIATVRQIGHDWLTSDEIGTLIDEVETEGELSEIDEALLRVVRRDYERATRLPKTLVARLAKAVSLAKESWKTAREKDDFSIFAPDLESILELNREKAEALGYEDSIYDPLLDEFEPDFTGREVEELFSRLRSELVPIVHAIAEREEPDTSFLRARFPTDVQWDFGIRVIEDFGFDMSCGRQDLSAHPFTTTFDVTDVRLTTRISEDFFSPAFFGTLHEAGHGMYEQGVDPKLARTPLASGTSLGMHESQSRLWENLVGRSRPFWRHYYPLLKKRFGVALGEVDEERFYRGINRVAPTLVRVESDEVTYNLHIMIRFEIEIDLLEGQLRVDDVPQAWNERMRDYLGIAPASDARGALQDIHWSLGTFGYFPTYTLGNLMSVQLYDQARADIENLDQRIAQGVFDDLLDWLRTNVHRHGRSRSADRILRDVCGEPLSAAPWLAYVRRKFGDIYGPLP